ncbi:MAG: hypothetical protein ABJM29_05070 [Rhizobiaceae bacterium]
MSIQRFIRPEYLAIYVSIFAVILSQFPPVYQIFATSNPAIVLERYVTVGHNLGRTVLFVPVTISNTGGRPLIVSKVECVLEAVDSSSLWNAPAQSYIDKRSISPNSPAVELPIGQLLVRENQRWQEAVLCYKLPDLRQNRAAQLIYSETNQFISDTISNRSPADQSLVELPASVVDSAMQELNRNFDLKPGDYRLSVRLLTAKSTILAEHSARLSLDQSEIDRLRNMRRHYQFGYGISVPHPNNLDKLYKTLEFYEVGT